MASDAALELAQVSNTLSHLPDKERELIGLWLQSAARRSSCTFAAYLESVRLFTSYSGARVFAQVKMLDVARWQEDLSRRLSPASVDRHLSAIKSLYSYGCHAGVWDRNPAAPIRRQHVDRALPARILAEADVLKMLELAKRGRNRTIVRILYAGGLRVSELCALHWRDVHRSGESGVLVVRGKGRRTRSVRLSTPSWSALLEYGGRSVVEPDRPVFEGSKGAPISRKRVYDIVRRAAARAQLEAPVSPHWLRHAHATHAIERGAPVHLVQRTLGHGSITTTGRYLHARPTESSSSYLAV